MDIKIGQCYIDSCGIFKVTSILNSTVTYDDIIGFKYTRRVKGLQVSIRYFTEEEVKPINLTRLERIIYGLNL